VLDFIDSAAAATTTALESQQGTIDTLISKDMYFAIFCVVLLFVLWRMIQASDAKSKDHATQIERIYQTNDSQEKVLTQIFTEQIQRMADAGAVEREKSINAFNKVADGMADLRRSIDQLTAKLEK
jgi:hypothetical protein